VSKDQMWCDNTPVEEKCLHVVNHTPDPKQRGAREWAYFVPHVWLWSYCHLFCTVI